RAFRFDGRAVGGHIGQASGGDQGLYVGGNPLLSHCVPPYGYVAAPRGGPASGSYRARVGGLNDGFWSAPPSVPSSRFARSTSSRSSSQMLYMSWPYCGVARISYTARGRSNGTCTYAFVWPGWAVITMMRSASTIASSMLWVMNTTVLRV